MFTKIFAIRKPDYLLFTAHEPDKSCMGEQYSVKYYH